MKRVFYLFLIFLLVSTQLSQSIVLAEGDVKQEGITIKVEEGSTIDQTIVNISVSNDVDNLIVHYFDSASFDSNFETSSPPTFSNDKEGKTLHINDIKDVEEIRFALTNLSEGDNELLVEAFKQEELITSKDFTFQLTTQEQTQQEKNETKQEETVSEQNERPTESTVDKAEINDSDVDNEAVKSKTSEVEDSSSNDEDSSSSEEPIFTPFAGNLNVDIDVSSLNSNVSAGNDAAYKLVFKTTGSIAEYTNAEIRVNLPEIDSVTFTQPLSDLQIAGVEPRFDAEMNQLVYEFDSINTGQTYENIIKLQTANGITPNGTELDIAASFEADQQALVNDTAQVVIDASTTVSASKQFTSAIGNDRNLPIPGSGTVWKMKADIPKSSIGQSYLEEGSDITVIDTLPDGLSYDSMREGPEPVQNGNQLIWKFEAPSIQEQSELEDTLFSTELEVVLTAGNNTEDETLTNNLDVSATFVGGNENNVNANDDVTIVDSEKATGDIKGSVYVPAHYGPSNGEGGRGTNDNKDPNPLVYDDSILSFSHSVSPLHESKEGDFRSYTTRYEIDPNLIFKEMKTPGNFVFRPGSEYPSGVPLSNDPVFNIEARIDGNREVLIENAEGNSTYTRADLGIAEGANVGAIFLNFTYAPSGMSTSWGARYYFEVEPGYVGDVTNVFHINGVGGEGTAFGTGTNGRPYNNDPLAGPRHAEVIPKPTDQPPIATVDVSLTDHQGSYVDVGENRMSVNLNTENSSTLAMNGPLETTVLLPTGITISDNPDSIFYNADGNETSSGGYEIISDNYNGTGRQLVKFNWEDRLLRPGNNVNAGINVEISEGAPNVLRFDVYGFSGDEELNVPTVDNPGLTDTVLQTDASDLNGDGNEDQPRLKSGNEYYMSGQYNVQTEKLVKGELDEDFGSFGSTVPGGDIDYQLTLTNTTGDTISSMTLMDVLPSVGDLGITDNIDRGSRFTPTLNSAVQVPGAWGDRVDVYYSTAATPERDDLTKNTDYPDSTEQLSNPDSAEAPNWTLASEVDDWSSIHSFKMELKDGVEWAVGEDITIAFSMIAPDAADVDPAVLDKDIIPSERAAWNSFALATDQGQPVEPARVGVYMDLDNSVQLTKEGEDGELLQGAEFSIINGDNQEIASGLTTNVDGVIIFEDLLPGSYEFVETSAPEGYQLDPTPIPFEIELAQQAQVEVSKVNEFAPGSVELIKQGEDGELLQGVEFELQDAEGATLQDGLLTDENGVLTVADLKPGNYQFVEIATNDGYDVDSTPIPFEIVFAQEDPVQLEVENPLSTGSVELLKVGEEDDALEGAVFTLVDENNEELQTGLTTNENGKLNVGNLKPGNYAFIETKAPFGYQLDATPIEFEIEFNQQEVLEIEVENFYTPSTLELTKQGEDGSLLEGVEFELQDTDGETLQTDLVTNDEGKVILDDLTPGLYQLVEVATLPGYDLDETPLPFEIGLGQTDAAEVTFENPLSTGGVQLTKVGESQEALEGAVFTLVDDNGDELETGLTTNADGVLIVEGLKPGNYAFVEMEAPFGYQLDETPIEFEIIFNQKETLEIEADNELSTGAVQLTKQGEDGAELEDVVFELQTAEGETLLEDLRTGQDGILFIEDLKPGNYQLIETATIPGYDLDQTPIPFEIEFGQTGTTEVSFENPLTPGAVELLKVNEEGETLEGAVFTLVDENGEELQTDLTTNADGVLLVEDLNPGNYAFVETEAPFGYQLDETPIEFEIVFNQQETLEIEVENLYIPSTLELTKEGEDGSLLEGVEFALQDVNGETLREGLLTNENGKLVLDDLTPGTYQLVETATLPGYELDDTPITFDIGLGQSEVTEVSFENPLSTGSVELVKVNEDGETLEGAVFTLVDENGEELQTDLTTNADGVLTVEDLKPGNYAFVETEAPFGYQLDETPIEFEIVFNQQETLEIEVENRYIPSTLELTKEGEDGSLLEGVEFELQNAEGETLRDALLTDENGKLVLDDLTPGSYQLIETATLPGYDLDPTPLPFEVSLGETEIIELSFENPLSTGSVELVKVNESGDTLEDAVFTLVDENGEELQTDLTTNADGVLLVKDLKPGNYAFVETEAPFGYQLDETPIEFEIVFNQQETLEIEVENLYIPSTLELTKEGEDGSLLEGVEFALQDVNGETLREGLLTNENGKLVLDDLTPGTYQLVETATLPGYELDDTPITFDIGLGQSEVTEVSFENPLSTGSVELVKVNEDGETLEGAVFTLVDENGEELQTDLTTNADGVLTVENLKPGNYAFVETEAPFGYQLDDTPIEFEIVFNQQEMKELEAENKILKASLHIYKVDATTDKVLEGAVFDVVNDEGDVISSLETNTGGKAIVEGLKPGEYQLIETKAPQGYQLLEDPISFNVEIGELEKELVIENTPEEQEEDPPTPTTNDNNFGDKLPQTGEEWLRYLTILGMILIGLGSCFLCSHVRKFRKA
ncbi:SpaA isopeptide-forming pilin-related protein [Oceanobacillus sp. ISL-73]|uniref:SpaA isopeptide-forming pilin-related protein n=1 Tax=Oceanobacillus sp. ISL-73 TaxID=2819161 RepID=UPI001BE50DF9|nr:SpaA isopeptide-forming pilin-related protein [Oceanobacillus sp. ISL-73]MBT2653232.1 collagen binding domain-containing protein [Oceanobacillus sp. ISL-73]